MTVSPWFTRLAAAGLAMLLAGCLLMPGKFVSELDIRRSGQFSFTYTGEIHVLTLSKLAQLDSAQAPFTPSPCHDETRQRECTAKELAEQKTVWEDGRRASAERKARDAAQMKPLLGDLDMSDPRAAEELAQRLRKQAGWRKVEYRGDGRYEVDFRMAGQLSHDFRFPTVERFANAGSFVDVVRRADGTVRIDAAGFGPAAGYGSLRSMAGMAASGMTSGAGMPEGFPVIDGTFTLRTDGAVLANNTDDGPAATTAGTQLSWTVTARSTAAPMALLRLTP